MRKTLLAAAAAGALVVGGGAAYAAIPSSSGVIKACYDNGGNLRVIDETKTCARGLSPLSWNVAGVPGADGADGVSGYEIVESTGTADDLAGIKSYGTIILCPTGKLATGGGARSSVTAAGGGIKFPVLLGSSPGNDGRSWDINVGMGGDAAFAAGDVLRLTMFAVCVNAL